MSGNIEGAVIEIIENRDRADEHGTILPNEIRINGKPVLAPAAHPVVVHEISMSGSDLVQVTLTLFAKRITVSGNHPTAEAGE